MDNGLYFMRVEPATGGKAENGGILVLRNGRILGGDAFFYYVGDYSAANGSWKGEFVTKQHTRSRPRRVAAIAWHCAGLPTPD
jgi:hypothetical protein